jgi:riboflavin biosynthesis pyrimidine reductase
MKLSRVFPEQGETIDLDGTDARERLANLYRPPRADWLRLNLIASVSGAATGSDGTSDTLTNAADRTLLGVIRSLSDVVLVGAQSIRAEGYFVPRHAALAVVTSSGDLTGHRITSTGQRGPLLVLCPQSAAQRAHDTIGNEAEVIVVADTADQLSADDIIDTLHAAGYASIVSEGGPKLAAHLLAGNVLDELCLSTSPLLNGASIPVFGGTEFRGHPLELTQLLVDSASGVYARWSVADRPDGDTAAIGLITSD